MRPRRSGQPTHGPGRRKPRWGVRRRTPPRPHSHRARARRSSAPASSGSWRRHSTRSWSFLWALGRGLGGLGVTGGAGLDGAATVEAGAVAGEHPSDFLGRPGGAGDRTGGGVGGWGAVGWVCGGAESVGGAAWGLFGLRGGRRGGGRCVRGVVA